MPPRAEVQVFEDTSRSILSRNDAPDLPFRWSLNPYRGCAHACAYCYARPSHEYWGFGAGTDFETKLMVKPAAPRLLREAFLKPSWKGELIVMSGNTDCYQPLEASWGLTRGCLEVLRDFRNPVGIITKSPLILRDIDLLKDLHRDARLDVVVSIAFADDGSARRMEPGAPSITRRLRTVEALAGAGLFVTVSLAPVIPGLNDSMAPAILKEAKARGARAAFYAPLRLTGSGEVVFLQSLRERFPLAAAKVEAFLRDQHAGRGERGDLIQSQFRLWRSRLVLEGEHPMPVRTTFRRPGARQAVFGFAGVAKP